MTSSERMQVLAEALLETAKVSKQALLETEPDESVKESSLAYFAGQLGTIIVGIKRFHEAVNRIDGWHKQRQVKTNADVL